MNRLRQKIESIVFAGLKPHDPRNPGPPPPDTWLRRLRARIDRFIMGGPPPSDPLYLTNRTWEQKLRAWTVVAVPLLIVGGGIALTLSHYLGPPAPKPIAELSPAEVAARVLPNIKDIKVESNHSLDVVEASIQRSGGVRIVGKVKNTTDHEIAHAEISCDLTDAQGTALGSISVPIENIPPAAIKSFDLPVKQSSAQFALIREVITR
jgi:hypothetical protein